MTPRLLDLFCGAGGAAMGYHRVGFEVVGVDIKPQPHYPFKFYQQDALSRGWATDLYWSDFDAIHASPPCQAFTRARSIQGRAHLDLLTPCRQLLEQSGVPWVIENVPGAPMRSDYVLCGTMFGLTTRRHRWFEVSWGPPALLQVPCSNHRDAPVQVFGHGGGRQTKHLDHFSRAERREAMGIDWMTNAELAQAIPPVYTEFIGQQLLAHLPVIVENCPSP